MYNVFKLIKEIIWRRLYIDTKTEQEENYKNVQKLKKIKKII